ncbi:N-acetylmuramoyl-L-alanine amidase [Phaeacidiphilus oryzae]|uniref:N-acetylmuramoyl-L-alanine amidase n=1 Tax=Phaeacidiphilus oryzae TaxID=348818 RepID=UPI000689B60A|nr:N-acetylmuramoyl-L-alanine amidase [Phaeacidiphilus oryzae]
MPKGSAHGRRSIPLKAKAWIGVGTVLVAGGGIAAVAYAGTDGSGANAALRGHARVAAKLAATTLADLPSGSSLRLGGRYAGAPAAGLGQRSTSPFNLVGVSWTDPHAQISGTVQIRTKSMSTGAWTDWQSVDASDTAPDPGAAEGRTEHGSTEPLWTGPSDGVEVRVLSDKPGRALPKGLRLNLVSSGDLGTVTRTDSSSAGSPSGSGMQAAGYAMDATATATDSASATDSATATDSASASASASASDTGSASASTSTSASASASATTSPTATVPPAPTSTAPKPPIVDRAGWGADETLREQTLPDYSPDGVKEMWVHHTDQTNSYVCSTDPTNANGSAALIQADYTYHVQVNGWRDLGYNFMVDKCGTIFEGRWGGLDNGGGEALPVIGAHTYGWNTDTMGVAVLGTYTTTSAPTAVLTSLAALADWKFGMYGIDPAQLTYLTAGFTQNAATNGYKSTSTTPRHFVAGQVYDFPAISGHRDGYATECPGDDLYAQLASIRSYAEGPAPAPAVTGMTGANKNGSTWYTTGKATVTWSESWPSALLRRFDVLVDGKVVASPSASTRSLALSLAAGTHSVTVRAVHARGGTSTSAAATVVADTTKPVFTTAPNAALRTGTVSSTSAPVGVNWKATDNTALRTFAATSPSTGNFALSTTYWNAWAKVGASTTWAFKATDWAGNYATASVARSTSIVQETSTTRTGTWTKRSSSSYLGGYSYSSGSKGASISWTFTGRSVAWVVSRASTSGQVYVYVDGVKLSTVDLKSASTLYRQAIWTKSWSSSGTHTLKIVVVGTSGRPTITTDGIVVLK